MCVSGEAGLVNRRIDGERSGCDGGVKRAMRADGSKQRSCFPSFLATFLAGRLTVTATGIDPTDKMSTDDCSCFYYLSGEEWDSGAKCLRTAEP
jgi:hypothetical protein